MSYMALYRKWRPDAFEEIKGQEHIVTTIRNQIVHDRVGHAYLFCGTRGTGKTTTAKLMAKAVNCEHPVNGSPCNECASCKAIAAGASMNVIEVDAASNNGVDNIRQITDSVNYSPSSGKYLVYIIDEVHMLRDAAYNALLKTLEEPPSYVIFILATTESHKIPATIMSRCQRYDFHRISLEVIADRLQELLNRENIPATREAVEYVARAADGSMRDGLSILEQCISYHMGEELTLDKVLDAIGAVDVEVYIQLFENLKKRDVVGALKIIDEAIWQGKDLLQLVNEFTGFIRNILVLSIDTSMTMEVNQETKDRMIALAQDANEDALMHAIYVLQDASAKITYTSSKRVMLELAIIKLCKPEMRYDVEGMNQRIELLEKQLAETKELLKEQQAHPVVMTVTQPADGAVVQQPAVPVGDSSEHIKQNLRDKYPQAEYEDLLLIAKAWKTIGKRGPRLVQHYYRQASLVAGRESGTLELVVADTPDNDLAISYFANQDKLDELGEQLTDMAQCKVRVTFRKIEGREEAHELQKDWDLSRIVFDDIEMHE